MAEQYTFDGVPTIVDVDIITPILYWEARHETFRAKEESKRIYRDMEKENRQAVVERVRRAIEIMHDNVDEWLPSSFSLNDVGTCLNITYSMVLTDIEEDAAARALVTNHRLKEASKELKVLLKELEEE